ncbi:anthranilate synthase component I family protein [uncultured Paludibaculum sp.]|uniref:anthranilate synthase component I family protein n=1 Tax=uncultured Paludibaculum sp. TaxID=1765020 RepID=UPI002AAB05C4|nr:anthranilate synthase component I family protein [uncultured Paludibaculum sp.]
MTWWQRPGVEARRALVRRLHGVLPAAAKGARTYVEHLESTADPLDVAEALCEEPGFLWLDSAGGASRLFTRPLVTLAVTGRTLMVNGELMEAGGFEALEAALAAWAGPAGALLVGFLGYDLAGELEQLPSLPSSSGSIPDLYLALYDSHWVHDGGWTHIRTDAWRETRADEPPVADGRIESAPPSEGPVSSTPGAVEFEAAVGRTVDRIYAGELFQTNLCRRLDAPLRTENMWDLYRRLRALNPSRYGAYLPLSGGRAVLSTSPELYLQVQGGRVRSSPIKGTRPLGVSNEDDARLAAELLDSVKERAELAMIVDVVRNDLARVCVPGTVRVDSHAELMRLPTLMHTVSTVSGRLREDAGGLAGLLRASFPPASISGAPKIHAMEVALAEEKRRRGPCMGGIGWISMDGSAELSVAIRTAVVADRHVYYETGCGITASSDPAMELEETRHKARAFLRALGCEETN